MIVPQSILQICSIINSIGECKIKPADFQILLAQKHIFAQIRTLQVRAYAVHAKLSDKESFCHKISFKRAFWFGHDNWYVNSMERPFFHKEVEARRELAGIGLISKHHYHPQMIHFDILDDPRWQANIEENQGRFQLDCYRPFDFHNGSMVSNPCDHNWIPNATDNPWANCSENPRTRISCHPHTGMVTTITGHHSHF